MIHETIFTKTIARNPGPDLTIEPEFRPLFHSSVLRHGNNHIRFPCNSTRLSNLMGKFSKRHKLIKWSVDFADIETYDDPSHKVGSGHKTEG